MAATELMRSFKPRTSSLLIAYYCTFASITCGFTVGCFGR